MGSIWVILLQLFGPLLVELFRKLLEKWFKKAEKNLKGRVFGSDKEGQLALLAETKRILPKTARIRRKIIDKMAVSVESGKATDEDTKGLMVLLANSLPKED